MRSATSRARYCFGRILVKEPKSRIGAFFAGWGILRAVALIPGIGVLVWIAASVWGIGALTIAALASRSRRARATARAQDARSATAGGSTRVRRSWYRHGHGRVRGRTSGYGNCVDRRRTPTRRPNLLRPRPRSRRRSPPRRLPSLRRRLRRRRRSRNGAQPSLDEAPQPERVHRVRQPRRDRRQRVGQQDHAEHREHCGGDQGERARVPLDPSQGCGETAEREPDGEERARRDRVSRREQDRGPADLLALRREAEHRPEDRDRCTASIRARTRRRRPAPRSVRSARGAGGTGTPGTSAVS